MIARLLFTAALVALLQGCSTTPAPPVNEQLRQKQIAQDTAYAAYQDQNWKAAARNFGKTADLLNAFDDHAGEAAARHNQARALQHDGQFDAAIAAYERALAINQRLKRTADQALNLAGLAQCHQKLGRLAPAIETAEQALPLAAGAPAATLIIQNDLAALLLERNQPGDADRAQKLLDAALAADPKAAITQLNLGRAALVAGQIAAARARFTQALEGFRAEGNPAGIAGAHEWLARCCAAAGDREAARFHHEQARQKYAFLKNAAALKRLDSFPP
ncbi:MAG: tetratricopeptide repeat protein [Verrucomicrobia bacterium]|nr:tetratricopeptide repeat protein [Verrucomicrobiota bacterium]